MSGPSNEIQERKTYFIDVILPVPIPKFFTYRAPMELNDELAVGRRVIAPFGKKKILTGAIVRIHETPPADYEARYIIEVLDDSPTILPIQIDLFRWIAAYYMCAIGETFNMALPSGLKLSSESKIQLNPSFNAEETSEFFTDRELEIINAASRNQSLTYRDIEEILGIKNFNHIIKSLLQKQAIIIYEEVRERYAPKKEKRLRLTQELLNDKSKLEQLFSELEKQPKQLDILLKYLQEVPVFQNPSLNKLGIEKQAFKAAGLSMSACQTLVKNKVFEEFTRIVSRFGESPASGLTSVQLSPEQEAARDAILTNFQEKDIVLLHGVTGSGKTEIYIDLALKALESGGQVLYLLPEIALTTQIVGRLKKVFGDKMGVYHSRFSDNERVETWRGVVEGKYPFVVGVRSAVFLPFSNLSLVIVDEEHENSYKQFDPAPRYHARDTAMVLARMHGAKTLLGSATPSIESYYMAQTGKYGFVELTSRYGGVSLPETRFIDLRQERNQQTLKGDFSSAMIEKIREALGRNEQAIIFQNRRGYAPHITCDDCAWIPKCENCDVSLTYHMYRNELRCHYCGFTRKSPSQCPACGSTRIRNVGFGTEKLEEDLKLHVPEARIKRMDLDTTRRKYSYQTLIEEFEMGKIDVLVGTQMVTKGLDFDRVSLVGILDADRMIHFPDFRSFERSFQLITQVSGRAGRREKPGLALIQTANVNQPILNLIRNNDFAAFYRAEIAERKKFNYPPFSRLVRILMKHESKGVLDQSAAELANLLKQKLNAKRVLGPEEPLISRIRNLYLMQIFIKIERDPKVSPAKAKELIVGATEGIIKKPEYKKLTVVFDVDPY